MPVLVPALSSSVAGQLAARGLVGPFNINLANGVAQGSKNYLSSLIVQGTAVGTLGGGTGSGTFQLNPATGSGLIAAALQSQALPGLNHTKVAQAVAFGLSTVINSTALVQTAVTGVAVGSEIGQFINPNPALATSLVFAGLTANAIVGPQAKNLAAGIGIGVAQWFQTGILVTAVAGAPVFPFNATTGVGIGSVQ